MPPNKENLIFEREPLLTGRTQIESNWKINTSDFELSTDNTLNLKNKTSYWSCSGHNFIQGDWLTGAGVSIGNYDVDGFVYDKGEAGDVFAPVFLPHGAIVTAVIVYGSDTGNTWSLKRNNLAANPTQTTMATAAFGTEDTTITSGTIDNSGYTYFLEIAQQVTDTITGARITYTTDYD